VNKRHQTIWILLVVLTLIAIGATSYQMYPVYRKWERAKQRSQQVQFGTDQELESIIEFLENRLKARSEYQFKLEAEPLRLTNVLYLTDASGRRLTYRNRGKLRVTAVFLGGSQPQAIIRYKDKNYTVAVGDSVAQGEVVWIDDEEVVIVSGDKEIHYPVAQPEIEEDVTLKRNHRSVY
jgi:Tfp pilus assembly protein PilP